mgnify:CR=1 FL=1
MDKRDIKTINLRPAEWRALQRRRIDGGFRTLSDVVRDLLTRASEPGQLVTNGGAPSGLVTPEGTDR